MKRVHQLTLRGVMFFVSNLLQLERRRVKVFLASSGDEAIAMFTAHSDQIDAVGTLSVWIVWIVFVCGLSVCCDDCVVVVVVVVCGGSDAVYFAVMDYLMPGKNGVQSAEALKRIMATLTPPTTSQSHASSQPPPLRRQGSGPRTPRSIPIAVLSATFDGTLRAFSFSLTNVSVVVASPRY